MAMCLYLSRKIVNDKQGVEKFENSICAEYSYCKHQTAGNSKPTGIDKAYVQLQN